MNIHITEHKSSGALRNYSHVVRVFVDRDYHYGYWVEERELFILLSPEQQAAYLAAPSDIRLDVTPETAQRIIDVGDTPYTKRQVA